MMILSDNTATDLVVEEVGKKKVNATLRELGLEKTRVVVDCRDFLFDLVELGYLPDARATMGKCQTGIYRISKYLPREEIEFAHKTGSLPGVRNDVGIVTHLKTCPRYIICCFTKDAEDIHSAEEVIARVSEIVYSHFKSD